MMIKTTEVLIIHLPSVVARRESLSRAQLDSIGGAQPDAALIAPLFDSNCNVAMIVARTMIAMIPLWKPAGIGVPFALRTHEVDGARQ